MANGKQTLVQRIALEGGDAIEKELKALGAEGEAAFKKLKASADTLAASGTGINGFFARLRADMTTIATGAAKVKAGFQTIGEGVHEVATRFQELFLAEAAIGGLVVGLVELTKSAAEAVAAQGKAAQSAGLTAEAYGKLKFAFEQGKVSADQFGIGMKAFNKQLAAAQDTGQQTAGIFAKLGVNVRDSAGQIRPTEAVLTDVADALAKLPDGAQKSADALKLFGKSGAALIPVLNQGGAAIRSLGDDAVALGVVFDEAQIKVGENFEKAEIRLTTAIGGIKNQLGLTLAPAFTEAFGAITDILVQNKDNILAFGKTISDQIIPIVKDLVSILKGDDAAVVNKNLLGIRDTFVSIGSAVKLVADIITTVFVIVENTLQPVVDIINLLIGGFNALFGTSIPKINAAMLIFVAIGGEVLGIFKLIGATVDGSIAIFEGLSTIFGATTAKVIGFIAQGLLLQGLIRTLVNDVLATLHDSLDGIGKAFQDLGALITATFKTVLDNTLGFFKQIIDGAGAVINAVGKALGKQDPLKAPNDQGGGFAGGGPVVGAGTGTSDSILTRLSNGEFVMRAAAVQKWGTDFLHSLNRGRLPGFADGGLVGAARGFGTGNAAAAGGPSRTLNLTIGEEVFEGLLAPDTVADKLVRFATTRNVRRAAVKPSWA